MSTQPPIPSPAPVTFEDLTSGDIVLLDLLARGYSGRRLARAVGYSEATTRRRVSDLRRRTGAATTIHAVAEAVRTGIL